MLDKSAAEINHRQAEAATMREVVAKLETTVPLEVGRPGRLDPGSRRFVVLSRFEVHFSLEEKMAFVNEVIPEEDVRRYELDDVMRKYEWWNWRGGRPAGFLYHWTVDRERGAFLLPIMILKELGSSGLPEPANRSLWLLDVRGKRVTATLGLGEGSSSRFADVPFKIIWELVDLDISSGDGLARSEALAVLKEALTVHGHGGVLNRASLIHVEFKF